MPEPKDTRADRGEAAMQPGETRESNTVFSTVASAKQVLGDGFTIETALSATKFAKLSDLEKAYLQRRLRKELKVELPEALRVDEAILEKAAPPPPPRLEAAAKPPAPEKPLKEKVKGYAAIIEQKFKIARERGEPFSIKEYTDRYRDSLGDGGIRLLTAALSRKKVTDLGEAVEEGPELVSKIVGMPPEEARRRGKPDVQRFVFNDGQLNEVVTFEGEEGEETRPTYEFERPPDFEKIKDKPEDLDIFLRRAREIYRQAGFVKLVPAYDADDKLMGLKATIKETATIPGFEKRIPLAEIPEGMKALLETQGEKYYLYMNAEAKDWVKSLKRDIRRAFQNERARQEVQRLIAPAAPAQAPVGPRPARPTPVGPSIREPAPPVPPRPVAPATHGETEAERLAREAREREEDRRRKEYAKERSKMKVFDYLDRTYSKFIQFKGKALWVGDVWGEDFPSKTPMDPEIEGEVTGEEEWRRYLRDWISEKRRTLRPPSPAPPPAGPAAETAKPIAEPVPSAAAPRSEGPAPATPAPPRPEREREVAREAVLEWRRKVEEIQGKIAEAKMALRKYEGLGWFHIGSTKGAPEHRTLRLGLEALEGPAGELEKAQKRYEKTKEDALRLGMTAGELEPPAPAPEAPEAAPPPPAPAPHERPAGAMPGAPETPPPGVAQNSEALSKWEKRKIWGWQIAKGLAGAGGSILGVKFFYDAYAKYRDHLEIKKEKEDVQRVVKEIDELARRQAPSEETRAELGFGVIAKAVELKKKVDDLEAAGRLRPQDRENFMKDIQKAVDAQRAEAETARKDLQKEVGDILKDYVRTKVTKSQLAREALNTVFVATGLQVVRGLTMLGLAGFERAAKARRDYELSIRATRLQPGGEAREASFWEREKHVWQDVFGNARREYWRSLKGQGATAERTHAMSRAMDFAKALGTTLRFVGIGSAAIAEMQDSGVSISHQIERALQAYEQKGALKAIGDNYVHNAEQILHVSFGSQRDGEVLQSHADMLDKSGARAYISHEHIPTAADLHTAAGKELLEHNKLIASLINAGKAELKVFPDGHQTLDINLGDPKAGFTHIEQAIRRLIFQETAIKGDRFTALDGARVENMGANLKDLLRGDHTNIEGLTPEGLSGIAHLERGKLVIDDYSRFENEVMPKLTEHAGRVINERSGALAYANNTSHGHWQEMADAKGEKVVVENFDQDRLVKAAEMRHFEAEARAHFGEGTRTTDVANEGTGLIQTPDGAIVIPFKNGVAHEFEYTAHRGERIALHEPLRFDDPLAAAKFKEEFLTWRNIDQIMGHGRTVDNTPAHELFGNAAGDIQATLPPGWQVNAQATIDHNVAGINVTSPKGETHSLIISGGKLFGIDGAPVRPDEEVPLSGLSGRLEGILKTPHRFDDIVAMADTAKDHAVHLGKYAYKPELLEKIKGFSTDDFIERFHTGAEQRLVPLEYVGNLKELNALADTMANHYDPYADTVGELMVRKFETLKDAVGRETFPREFLAAA